jgi:hypothetical protein
MHVSHEVIFDPRLDCDDSDCQMAFIYIVGTRRLARKRTPSQFRADMLDKADQIPNKSTGEEYGWVNTHSS